MTSISGFGGFSPSYKYYEFELDSLDCRTGYTNDYAKTNWPLFKIGGKRPLQNIAAVKILEVQIPFTYYVFNGTNNTFQLDETGQVPVTVTIPVGNYTMTQMATILATGLTAASLNLHTYTVSYDTPTQKMTIWNNVLVTSPFSLIMGTAGDTDGDQFSPGQSLGFPVGITGPTGFSAILVGANRGDFITSPFAIMLTGPNYLYVNSSKLGNLCDLYLPQGSVNLGNGNAGPQIAKIPVDRQAGDVMYWSDPDPEKWFDLENLPNLSEVDFYITLGNTSKIVDFNGQPFSLKLGVIENLLTKTELSSGNISNQHIVKRLRQL